MQHVGSGVLFVSEIGLCGAGDGSTPRGVGVTPGGGYGAPELPAADCTSCKAHLEKKRHHSRPMTSSAIELHPNHGGANNCLDTTRKTIW